MAKQQKTKLEFTAKEIYFIINILEEYSSLMEENDESLSQVKLLKKALKRNGIDVDKILEGIIDKAFSGSIISKLKIKK